MNDLDRRVAAGARRSLLAAATSAGTRWVAGIHVFWEMYAPDDYGNANKFEKLAKQAAVRRAPVSPSVYREEFERNYLPEVRFVDMGDVLVDHPLPKSVTHDKDVPTAQLAALVSIASCVVYSHDKHLRRPGIAPPDLEPVVGASIASSEAELVMAGAAAATAMSGTALSAALGSAAKALGVPKLATWSVLAVVVALGLSDERRRKRIGTSLYPLGAGLLEILAASEAAKVVLGEAAIAPPLPPPLECRVADVLVRSSGPLLVREISAVLAEGVSAHRESEQEIRALLRIVPCFVETTRHRWELGREMTSPATPAR